MEKQVLEEEINSLRIQRIVNIAKNSNNNKNNKKYQNNSLNNKQ